MELLSEKETHFDNNNDAATFVLAEIATKPLI